MKQTRTPQFLIVRDGLDMQLHESVTREMESFDYIVSVTVRHGLLQFLTLLRNGL